MNVRAAAVRAVFLLLAGCAAGVGADPAVGPSTSKPPDRVDDRRALDLSDDIEPLRKNHSLPALAAAVVKNGAIVASGVAGTRVVGERDPVEKTDSFHIASCTKSFTATLAGILVEEGKLSWAITIGQALPELRDTMRPEYREVTLRQLLSHTGGLPAYTNFGPQRLAELMALPGTHARQRLAFAKAVLQEEPVGASQRDDTGAQYSNAGYAVAACIIERAAEQEWEDLMRSRIFHTLGMKTAGFGWPATSSRPHQPRGHRSDDATGKLIPQPLDDAYQLPPCLWPAGAVHCSVDDLARYAGEHLRGLRGDGRLLRAETYQTLHRTVNDSNDGFTLGWGARVDPAWGIVHFGAGSGGTFFARIYIIPSHDLAVVVLTNAGTGGDATKELGRMLIERFRT